MAIAATSLSVSMKTARRRGAAGGRREWSIDQWFPACSHVTFGFMSANAPRGFGFQAQTCSS
jgi:hypothetical protein